MGSWDTGPFDNDTAMDLLGELVELNLEQRGGRVLEALDLPDGHLGDPAAQEAMAAAALVAGACGMEIREPGEAAQLVAVGGLPDGVDERELAKYALLRISGADSDWRDRWAEDGSLDEALTTCEDIGDYL